eukprot:g864.t1
MVRHRQGGPPVLELDRDVLLFRRSGADEGSPRSTEPFLADCELDTTVDLSPGDPQALDGLSLPHSPLPPYLRARFEIVYDCVYRVPSLCFRAWDEQGVAVSYDILENYTLRDLARGGAAAAPVADTDVMVTQIEHPYAGRPVFQIHPCRTAAVMGTMLESAAVPFACYLLAWLNLYGREAGLSLSARFYASAVASFSPGAGCGET